MGVKLLKSMGERGFRSLWQFFSLFSLHHITPCDSFSTVFPSPPTLYYYITFISIE